MIVDGPRDDRALAESAWLVTGSGNWSGGAATRYDENTLFLRGVPELVLRFQAEFELMWAHSRDVVVDASLPYELGTADLTIRDLDREDVHAIFTSENFSVSGDTFRITDSSVVSDALVGAIGRAERSIHVASGHLRSRPVAEALIAAKEANPALDVRVYLDGQEFISGWYQGEQLRDLDECLAEATTDTQERNCREKGFLFGYQVGEAGVGVRYKYYAYRWHYTYADQMHHKYLVIDGEELWTGSYNLSDNAERNTFENMLMFRGERFADLVADYEARFEAMWETNRDSGALENLRDDLRDDDVVPLVFDSMALTWSEVDSLKREIRSACPAVGDHAYRTRPEDHRLCFR
jgi:phosphatidylserine/phosphatidylglycerophosphate/cardiolipin synthase-like enzyme